MEILREVRIARPTGDIWAALADFGAISRWAPNVDHSCLTTVQAEGPGTVRRIQTGRNVLLERVTEWEPGRLLTYAIEGLPPVVGSVTNSWRLDGDGPFTTVSLTTTIDTGPRPPQKVVARVVGRMLAKASDQTLPGLDDHLREDRP